MKILKVFTAAAVSTALAATMALSASATTYEDAVQAAKDAGVQDINVQQLQNFLEVNADYFTSDDYDYMISVMDDVKEQYVTPLAMELFGKTPDELTEDEKTELGKQWSSEDRAAIIGALQDLGEEFNVEVDVDKLSKGEYEVEAAVVLDTSSDDDDDDENSSDADKTSSTSSSTSANTQTVVTNPVANTGDVAESGVNTGVAAVAGLGLVLAVTGTVVVARKNKE